MKPWTDLSLIEMPRHIAGLPRDERGYPIPVSATEKPDGSRDFRVVDTTVSHRCFTHHLCSICGQPLGRHRAFVGGPRSIVARLFHDLWMHKDCAEYALKTCPFLAAPKFAYMKSEPTIEGKEVTTMESVSTDRPLVFGLGITDQGASYVRNGRDIVIQAGPFHTTTWWANGKEITAKEAAEIMIAARVKK